MFDFCEFSSQSRSQLISRPVSTYIPEINPAHKIGMVDLTLRIYMLTRPDHHCLGGSDVDKRRLSRIGVRYP